MSTPSVTPPPAIAPRISVDDSTASGHPHLADRPRLWNPYYHLIRQLRLHLEQVLAARVLDYGCSTMWHRPLFPENIEYLGADLPGNVLAHIGLDDAGRLPAELEPLDMVFSTQLLEYVEDPALYLSECPRVLKSGGQLILSTHGAFIFHPCPSDYWRRTCMGLRSAVEKAGFEVTELRGICGGIPTALRFLQDLVSLRLACPLQPLLHFVFQPLIVAIGRLYAPSQRLRNACILMVKAHVLHATGSAEKPGQAAAQNAKAVQP